MTPLTELWGRLAAANLVAGPMPEDDHATSPWYVTAMTGIAAWIAAIFLLVFFGIALWSKVSHDNGAVTVGLVMCAACAVALRLARRGVFLRQAAVAMSLAGQALLAFGILESQFKNPAAWIALAAVEIALVAAAPGYLHCVLSTLAAACALRFALLFAGLAAWFPALVTAAFVLAQDLDERVPYSELWRPVIAGLALGALLVIPVSFTDLFAWDGRHLFPSAAMTWMGAIALGAVLLVAIARILGDAGVPWTSRTAAIAMSAGAAAALAARPVSGVIVALIVLLVAFAAGRRALAGLAIASMLAALSYYYYAMETTLLAKSAALFATGVVLVVAGLAVRFGLADPEAHRA